MDSSTLSRSARLDPAKSVRIFAAAAAAAALRRVPHLAHAWARRWGARNELRGMSEHMRRDIGLPRAEPGRQVDQALWRV